jgi:hypothetical protein
MSEPYASSLSVIKLKGRARVAEKGRTIVQLITDKIAGIELTDILDPSLIQSVCCCVEAAHGKRNRKNKVDKLALLLDVMAVVKKSALTTAEKVSIATSVEFCISNNLVRGAPLVRLIAANVLVFLKKTLL